MKTKSARIILISGGLIALVFLVLASLPSGPPWIPEQPPHEDGRIVHPLGFSIVKPPGWFVKVYQEGSVYREDSINLLATDKKIRSYPRVKVSAFTTPPNFLSNYRETTFLGMKAHQKVDLRAGRGDFFTYKLLITNQSRWYELLYQIPADFTHPSITNVPQPMLPYLQSFKPVP